VTRLPASEIFAPRPHLTSSAPSELPPSSFSNTFHTQLSPQPALSLHIIAQSLFQSLTTLRHRKRHLSSTQTLPPNLSLTNLTGNANLLHILHHGLPSTRQWRRPSLLQLFVPLSFIAPCKPSLARYLLSTLRCPGIAFHQPPSLQSTRISGVLASSMRLGCHVLSQKLGHTK